MYYYEEKQFTDVHIELTNACNFSCWMCPREAMTREIGMMDNKRFKETILDLYSANFLKHIHFGGFGEPTLHPHIIKMITFIKENTDFTVSLTTNASKFSNPSFIEQLYKTRIDKVYISFRHTVPDKISKSLPSNYNYERYVKSIISFVEAKQKMNYQTEVDLALLKDTYYSNFILDIKYKHYIDNGNLNYFLMKLSMILKEDLPSYDELTRGFSSQFTRMHTVNISKGVNVRFDGLGSWTTAADKYKHLESCHLARYGTCLGMQTHFSIYWNGDVSTCCADFDVKNKLGNIFDEESILKILSSAGALFYVENLKRCRMPTKTCQICRGGKNIKEKWANILGSIHIRRKHFLDHLNRLSGNQKDNRLM